MERFAKVYESSAISELIPGFQRSGKSQGNSSRSGKSRGLYFKSGKIDILMRSKGECTDFSFIAHSAKSHLGDCFLRMNNASCHS